MKFTLLPDKPAGKVAKEGGLMLLGAAIASYFLKGVIIQAVIGVITLYGFLLLIAALIISARRKPKQTI